MYKELLWLGFFHSILSCDEHCLLSLYSGSHILGYDSFLDTYSFFFPLLNPIVLFCFFS